MVIDNPIDSGYINLQANESRTRLSQLGFDPNDYIAAPKATDQFGFSQIQTHHIGFSQLTPAPPTAVPGMTEFLEQEKQFAKNNDSPSGASLDARRNADASAGMQSIALDCVLITAGLAATVAKKDIRLAGFMILGDLDLQRDLKKYHPEWLPGLGKIQLDCLTIGAGLATTIFQKDLRAFGACFSVIGALDLQRDLKKYHHSEK